MIRRKDFRGRLHGSSEGVFAAWIAAIGVGAGGVGAAAGAPGGTVAQVRVERSASSGWTQSTLRVRSPDLRFEGKGRWNPANGAWTSPSRRFAEFAAGAAVPLGGGVLHAGGLRGFETDGGRGSSVLSVARGADEGMGLTSAPGARGLAWVRDTRIARGEIGFARDRDERARIAGVLRRPVRGGGGRGAGVDLRALAIPGAGWSGTGSVRARGFALEASRERDRDRRGWSVALADSRGVAAARVSAASEGAVGRREVALGLGVPAGVYRGSRLEASIDPRPSSAAAPSSRARLEIRRAGRRGSVAGSIGGRSLAAGRSRWTGTLRGFVAASASATFGGSLSAESGRRAPESATFETAQEFAAARISCAATLSARRGRSVSLAIAPRSRGGGSWSLALRAEDRRGARTTLGVEVGWNAVLRAPD